MKKIHESLFILSKCHSHITENWEAIEKNQPTGAIKSTRHFIYNLAYYIILEIDIFLDEYHKEFASPENENAIRNRAVVIKEILKPVYTRIKSFKSLHEFRNNIVVHPLRRSGAFILPQNKLLTVPRSLFEYQLLTHYIQYMFAIIRQEFELELGEACFFAEAAEENCAPQKADFNQVNADTEKLLAEVKAIADKHQKDFTVEFKTYHHYDT
jgi:hypothetical protein